MCDSLHEELGSYVSVMISYFAKTSRGSPRLYFGSVSNGVDMTLRDLIYSTHCIEFEASAKGFGEM